MTKLKLPRQALDRTAPNFKKIIKAWMIHFRILKEMYIKSENATMQTTTSEFHDTLMKVFKEEAAKNEGRVDLSRELMAYTITMHLTAKPENVKLVREWHQMIKEDEKNHLVYDIADFTNEFVGAMLREGLAYHD